MRQYSGGIGRYLLFALAVAAAFPAAARAQQNQHVITDDAVREAIDKGVKFLWSTQQADGSWIATNTGHNDWYTIGPTAICAYALMEAGVAPSDPRMQKALEYIAKQDSEMTYCLAFRALAFSTAYRKDPKQSKYKQILAKDVKTLIYSMDANGGYSYWSMGQAVSGTPGMYNTATEGPDHSNCQYALLGVWAGAMRGLEIPRQYWDKIIKFWLSRQLAHGGWGYSTKLRKEGDISMTLAGLASVYVCIDNLHNQAALTCKGGAELPAVKRGMDYLASHFSEIRNRVWFYYTLYGSERVALATGFKYFGKHNWYKEGRDELLTGHHRQLPDGSWDYGAGSLGGGKNTSTAYALLFLVRGSRPVVFNRLEYDGDWNNRPRSLANLTRWFSNEFENDLHWQIVNFKVKVEEWHDAPLLVITGATEPTFTDAQIEQLRTFVYQGGTIFSINECGSARFKKAMKAAYEKIFPGRTMKTLTGDHEIYSTQYKLNGRPQLMEISNGVRPLAIHTDLDLARYWQLGNYRGNPAYYRAAANIVAYVSAKAALAGHLRSRGTSMWPDEPRRRPRLTVKVARLSHNANCDPEPLAWERFARQIGQDEGIKVEVLGPMEASDLEGSEASLAVMTGTGKLELTAAQKAGIKAWLDAGGTLLVDAAGGNEAFAESAEAALLEICEQKTVKLLASSADVYSVKGYEIRQAGYRHESSGPPRLRTVMYKNRMAVYFSRGDITEGLLGIQCHSVKGYTPRTASAIARNVLILASGKSVAKGSDADTGSDGSGGGSEIGAGALDPAQFVASACAQNDDAANAVDGDAKTKWDTGRAMKEGDWFQVDLGQVVEIKSILLDARRSPKNFPKEFKISLSRNGTKWASSNQAMRGSPGTQVSFPQNLRMRFVRIEVVSVDGDHPWSIHEFVVTARGGGGGDGGAKDAKGAKGASRPPAKGGPPKGVLPD